MAVYTPGAGVVIFRTPASYPGRQHGPRVGMVVKLTADEVRLRVSMGRHNYVPQVTVLPASCIARDATPRERLTGMVIDPVPGKPIPCSLHTNTGKAS